MGFFIKENLVESELNKKDSRGVRQVEVLEPVGVAKEAEMIKDVSGWPKEAPHSLPKDTLDFPWLDNASFPARRYGETKASDDDDYPNTGCCCCCSG